MTIGLLAVLAGIIVLVVVFAIRGMVTVRQSEAMVIERLGKYHRTLHSGIHVIWPIVDRKKRIQWRVVRERTVDSEGDVAKTQIEIQEVLTDTIDLREIVYNIPKQNAITKDNVNLVINALLYFQITDPARAAYEIDELHAAIQKLTQTTLRSVIGTLDLDETLSSRDTINDRLRVVLDEATDKWGVKINRVELEEIDPPPDIVRAMDRQMQAERERRAEVTRAQGSKTAAVLVAEGNAEARVKGAQAEAQAIGLISRAFADEKIDPAQYLIATKYIETLREMVSGQDNKIVYLPYEATAILGSIGGIKDLFKGTG